VVARVGSFMTCGPALLPLARGAALAGAASAGESPPPATPLVKAVAQTEPARGGGSDSAVIVAGADARAARIVGSAALGGLETYDLRGRRLASTPAGEAVSVAVATGVPIAGREATVLAALNGNGNELLLYRQDGTSLRPVNARPLRMDFAVEGVCLGRNPIDGALYAYVVGDGGEIEQLALHADASGRLDARPVRRLQVPSTIKQCAADAGGALYAMQETTGIWRFNGNPEADADARIVDAPG